MGDDITEAPIGNYYGNVCVKRDMITKKCYMSVEDIYDHDWKEISENLYIAFTNEFATKGIS